MMIRTEYGGIINIVRTSFAARYDVMHLYRNAKSANYALVFKRFERTIAKVGETIVYGAMLVVALAGAVFVLVKRTWRSIKGVATMGAFHGDTISAFVLSGFICVLVVVLVCAGLGTKDGAVHLRWPAFDGSPAHCAWFGYFAGTLVLFAPYLVALSRTELLVVWPVWALAHSECFVADDTIAVHVVLQIKSALASVRSCCLGNAERQSALVTISDFSPKENCRRLHCLDNLIIAQAF